MTRLIITLGILLLAIGGYSYYNWFYPPSVLRHTAQATLTDFATVIATKDRAKIGDMLKNRFMDGAHIHLEVSFFSFSAGGKGAPAIQEFDKSTFLTFVDNTLYSLSDYSFNGELQSFKLSPDRHSADITLSSNTWGDESSSYSGTAINMRFVGNSDCSGTVIFDNKHAIIDTLSCNLLMHSSPKPGEEDKLRGNAEAIRQMLK